MIETIGTFLSTLGPGGVLTLIVGFLLLLLVLKVGKALLDVVARLAKLWRGMPLWGKQIVAAFALFAVAKIFWPVLPKTTMVFALLGGGAMAWWVGAMGLARRYGMDMDWSGWNVWAHHAETVKMQRGLTVALENATGKQNGRARKPTITPTGLIATYEPPDTVSAQALCDSINDGTLEPSLARQIGWKQVNGTFAEVQGNVVAIYVSAIKADGDDPLARVHPWPGMEMK